MSRQRRGGRQPGKTPRGTTPAILSALKGRRISGLCENREVRASAAEAALICRSHVVAKATTHKHFRLCTSTLHFDFALRLCTQTRIPRPSGRPNIGRYRNPGRCAGLACAGVFSAGRCRFATLPRDVDSLPCILRAFNQFERTTTAAVPRASLSAGRASYPRRRFAVRTTRCNAGRSFFA